MVALWNYGGSEVKVFICHLREIAVREGVTFVRAPSASVVEDSTWAAFGETDYGLDELKEIKTTYEITGIREVTDINQVPKNWHKCLPWHHPMHEPADSDLTLSDLLPTGDSSPSKAIAPHIAVLERQKKEIESQIKRLRAMAGSFSPKDSKNVSTKEPDASTPHNENQP